MPQVLSQASDPLHEETDKYPGQLQPAVAMEGGAQELEDQGRLSGVV